MKVIRKARAATLDGEWDKAGLLHPITRFSSMARKHAHFQCWAENHEKGMVSTTTECILIGDELMIPLYQPNPHDNSVRKNVRGRTVVGVLLSLLHKFGLDFLSPGNLAEQVYGVNNGRFRMADGPYLLCPVKTFKVVLGLSLALTRSICFRVALQK